MGEEVEYGLGAGFLQETRLLVLWGIMYATGHSVSTQPGMEPPMDEPVKVILNPYAGRGGAGRARERVVTALKQAGAPFELVESEARGHAIELAREARAAGYAMIAAAGGDGTINEVLNGIIQATAPGAVVGKLALIPIGGGNDFPDMVGCPRDLDAAARVIARGQTRRVDIGRVALEGPEGKVVRYFDNNMGLGLEAQVTLESYQIKRLAGATRYLAAALRGLQHMRAPHAEVEWVTQAGEREQRAHPITLVTIGNSRRTGGMFFLTPDAVPDDGLLDLGVAGALTRLEALSLMPKALTGKPLDPTKLKVMRCVSVRVRCAEGLPVHLDGEVVMEDARVAEVEVEPRRLEIVV